MPTTRKTPRSKKTTSKKTTRPVAKGKPRRKTDEAMFIGFVVDRSGSMSSCRNATVSGFNEYLNDQKKEKGKTLVSLTLFNTDYDLRNVADPIEEVEELDARNYVPGGNTALYDAIGRTLTETEKQKGLPKKKVIVIVTDGEENSSQEYNRQTIFSLIREKEKAGWLFVYLGANQDAYAVGHAMGIQNGITQNYNSTPGGTKTLYASASIATSSLRSVAPRALARTAATLDWGGSATTEDAKSRKNGLRSTSRTRR